jgi:urea transporter
MNIKRHWGTINELILPAALNSYSIVFFLNNRLFAIGMIVLSFFNFYAGLSGLIATMTAVLIANTMGFDKIQLRQGLYSFNALLIGLGMGTFFDPGFVYFSLLFLAVLLTLILSVTLGGWLGKYGLPHLSIPFVIGFWLIVLPSSSFENLGLTQRNIYWINEAYSVGGSNLVNFLQSIDSLTINKLSDTYLRSLSSIFFQNNLLSGLLISVLLLISSRIAFTLSIIGFLTAYFFASFTGSATAGFSYYNIGANYIMTALAVGGFFVIPSKKSYLWTILLVPLTSLVLLFMTKLFNGIQLPVFSLPFSVVVIYFIYFLMLRRNPAGLILTPIQNYSPESNLYSYANNKIRLAQLLYYPLHLPFWGEWIVSQGHNGQYTHKGEWGKAFDFMLLDEEMKSFTGNGTRCEQYHCYNKPILAPADGVVEEIIDGIEDNDIGKSDLLNNWGNTITIRHLPGLYTQLSHLRKDSFKVAVGDHVKCGDILANCGNSGRSPQPHLHFQVQASPKPGTKTISYPFSYYLGAGSNGKKLFSFALPVEGEIISGVRTDNLLKRAFDLSPGTLLKFRYTDQSGLEHFNKWEAFTDAYNNSYLYCDTTNSSAYYVNDGNMLYFTTFYGSKNSLLYYFYLTAFKVLLGHYENLEIVDQLPLNTLPNRNGMIWINDFIAPFANRVKAKYSMLQTGSDDPYQPQSLTLTSKIDLFIFGKTRKASSGTILLDNNRIEKFTFLHNKIKIEATCISSSS